MGHNRPVQRIPPGQTFHRRTDNNPLTYLMTTPNLDAIGHQWVAALTRYNMTIEYLKGANNKIADILSLVPQRLDPETVTVLLNHARTSNVPWTEADDPRVMEEHWKIEEEVILWAHQMVRQDKHLGWCLDARPGYQPSDRVDQVAKNELKHSGWIHEGQGHAGNQPTVLRSKTEWFCSERQPAVLECHPSQQHWDHVGICGSGMKASSCPQWMSTECQSSRSGLDPKPHERMILVAWYGPGTSFICFQLWPL